MKRNTKKITLTAMFAAMASLLMFLEIPIPFLPPFLKLDISLMPVLIGGFSLGPVPTIFMAIIKAFVHLLSTKTGGVGELSDLILTASFGITAGIIYRKDHTKKGAKWGCILGTFVLIIMGALANYFILIPFYAKMMPLEQIFSMCHEVNPYINGMGSYILFGVIPFNILKGTVVSFLTFAVYKRMSRHIHKFIEEN